MHDEPVVYGRRDDDDPNNTSSYTVFPTGIAETRKKQKEAERSGAASPRRVLSPNRDVLKTLVERKQLIGTDAGERVAATIGNQDSIDNVVLYVLFSLFCLVCVVLNWILFGFCFEFFYIDICLMICCYLEKKLNLELLVLEEHY